MGIGTTVIPSRIDASAVDGDYVTVTDEGKLTVGDNYFEDFGEHEIEIIELQANAGVTPLDHDTTLSDTFSDSTGYLNSVDVGETSATFDTDKYKRADATAITGVNTAVTTGATGIIGEAFTYNGSTSVSRIPIGSLPRVNDAKSIGFWNKGTFAGLVGVLGTRGNIEGSTGRGYSIAVRNIDFRYDVIAGTGVAFNSTDYNDGVRRFFAITDDGAGNIKLYVNAVEVASGTVGTGTEDVADTFYLGNQGAAGGYAAGDMDEINLATRVWTQAELDALYNSGSAVAFGNMSESLKVGLTNFSLDDSTVTGNDFVSSVDAGSSKKIVLDLPTITGTVVATELIVNTPEREDGDDVSYDLKNDTETDLNLAIDTKNELVSLTSNPNKIEINLVPKETSPTSGYPSCRTYCLKVWKQ